MTLTLSVGIAHPPHHHLPATLPESDSHRAASGSSRGERLPPSPVPGPPQLCMCGDLVKDLPVNHGSSWVHGTLQFASLFHIPYLSWFKPLGPFRGK